MGKNTASHRRTHARRRIEALLREQDGKCHWCGREIFYITPAMQQASRTKSAHCADIPVEGSPGEWVTLRRATVDHVIPIRDGGMNTPGNLVAACYKCNIDRTATVSPYTVCRDCGVHRGRGATKKRCGTCVVKRARAWLTANTNADPKVIESVENRIRRIESVMDQGRNHNETANHHRPA